MSERYELGEWKFFSFTLVVMPYFDFNGFVLWQGELRFGRYLLKHKMVNEKGLAFETKFDAFQAIRKEATLLRSQLENLEECAVNIETELIREK